MIHFDNVTKMYQNQSRPALENITLDVEKGEFVFLVGPSGSGKSTFLRLVLKEERPTEGRIHVAGKDLARLTSWRVPLLRRRLGGHHQRCRRQDVHDHGVGGRTLAPAPGAPAAGIAAPFRASVGSFGTGAAECWLSVAITHGKACLTGSGSRQFTEAL